ncbi:MAG: cysteine desulfurase family protein [Oscillospiraceae bacterium]|nr:cysteine desulfurase family protein [Oscillospiraceae bacterium]MDD4413071.1 cysteine desulfurase family protein [Oscillospiraceae bacterium]
MFKSVHLDNAATTVVSREAAEKAFEMMTLNYGNPSSLHSIGVKAEQMMEAARKQVASLIGCRSGSIIFTSGGTESNNLALFGAVEARKRAGRHIITTAVEHSSVAAVCDELEGNGYEITRLVPDKDGCITPERVADACREDTVLVSIMSVNNENGAHFSIEEIIPAVRRAAPGALFHCDGVQAVGKLSINTTNIDVDLMTVSAHKIHGPKGCGALYIKKGVRIVPRAFGGGHERGLRAGTEAVPLIAAFGVAAENTPPPAKQKKIYDSLRQRLADGVSGRNDVIWLSPDNAVSYIVNLSVRGLRSETMLHYFAENGVYISSGSACTKGKKSRVLTALGLPDEVIDSSLRISFSHTNTIADVDRFLEVLEQATTSLIKR